MTKNAASAIGTVLSFSWSISRGRDTYGYNICTLRANGEKAGQCSGGGYDMKGTALADWMQARFPRELVKLGRKYGVSEWVKAEKTRLDAKESAREVYGLILIREEDGTQRPSLDGSCGFESMLENLRLIGLNLKYSAISRKDGIWTVVKYSRGR